MINRATVVLSRKSSPFDMCHFGRGNETAYMAKGYKNYGLMFKMNSSGILK